MDTPDTSHPKRPPETSTDPRTETEFPVRELLKMVNYASEYPEERLMFAPGSVKRTDGFNVDKELGRLANSFYKHEGRNGSDDTARNIHGLYHRTASIADLEPGLYDKFGYNPTSMGLWFPLLVEAHASLGSGTGIHIPKTRVMRLPIELAQFTRVEYPETNSVSRQAFNSYLFHALRLEDYDPKTGAGDYFIKTGTFSGKFQFANCHCTEPREMGEYFQVISNFAQQVGAGESIDIAVRDYIRDYGDNPTIYSGMPLRTEFRVFVDFGSDFDAIGRVDSDAMLASKEHEFFLGDPKFDPQIIGITNYWHPRVMKQHLAMRADETFATHFGGNTADDRDAFYGHVEHMTQEFERWSDDVLHEIHLLLPRMQESGFRGQWSIDVMLNTEADGSKRLYLIDMALMCESALTDELATVDEYRFAPLDEIRRMSNRLIIDYPHYPNNQWRFSPDPITDAHGVAHTVTVGATEHALALAIRDGIVNKGSIPFIEKKEGKKASLTSKAKTLGAKMFKSRHQEE